ncbi:MAG: LON peptidase substrate-binding domain-containing protein [Candidatus Sericytochromatia bacterium]
MEDYLRIPLFPLGFVLLPKMLMPLHIFEERYKLLINECIANNTEFGITYYIGGNVTEKGCLAKVLEVTKTYDDGRMDILVEGTDRFEIKKIFNDKPYTTVDAELFDDIYDIADPSLIETKEKGLKFLEKIMAVYEQDIDPDFVRDLSPKVISFLLVSNAGFTMMEKQAFLEMINTKERLEKGVKILKMLSDRLKTNFDIKKIIQSNGYLGSRKHL